MLCELRVENLLLIEQAQLRLAPGLNVLTGETGAGKTVLAHALDLKVIAGGVESEDQAKLLRLLKCDEMQGHLFSKPLPAEGVAAFVQRQGTPH